MYIKVSLNDVKVFAPLQFYILKQVYRRMIPGPFVWLKKKKKKILNSKIKPFLLATDVE